MTFQKLFNLAQSLESADHDAKAFQATPPRVNAVTSSHQSRNTRNSRKQTVRVTAVEDHILIETVDLRTQNVETTERRDTLLVLAGASNQPRTAYVYNYLFPYCFFSDPYSLVM